MRAVNSLDFAASCSKEIVRPDKTQPPEQSTHLLESFLPPLHPEYLED